MFMSSREYFCPIFNRTCIEKNVLQIPFSVETVNHTCSSITSSDDVDITSGFHMSIYIAWCFAKRCQIRAEPSKGSYAKEWAQWEQRLRATLFGNADHLNSIQVTIFHLLFEIIMVAECLYTF